MQCNARRGKARRGAVSVAAVAVGNRVLGSAGGQWAEMMPTAALQECTDNTTLYFLVDIIHFRMVPPCCSALLCSALRCTRPSAPSSAASQHSAARIALRAEPRQTFPRSEWAHPTQQDAPRNVQRTRVTRQNVWPGLVASIAACAHSCDGGVCIAAKGRSRILREVLAPAFPLVVHGPYRFAAARLALGWTKAARVLCAMQLRLFMEHGALPLLLSLLMEVKALCRSMDSPLPHAMQHVAALHTMRQRSATCCNMRQHNATCCNARLLMRFFPRIQLYP